MLRETVKLLLGFYRDVFSECSVLHRIVHVGKHEVLPDEDAQFIAEAVERITLIGHRAADTQHVHARITRQSEIMPQRILRATERENVVRGPTRTTAVNTLSIHLNRKPRIAAHFNSAEARSLQRKLMLTSSGLDDHLASMQRRSAMRMRPPQFRILNTELSTQDIALIHKFRRMLTDAQPCRNDLLRRSHGGTKIDDALVSHQRSRLLHVAQQHICTFQSHRSPRSHRRDWRRPARNAPQQARTYPAQLLIVHQVGFPARTRTFLFQVRRERTKADHQLILIAQEPFDIHAIAAKHVVGA